MPVVVGGGKRALPELRVNLELLDERTFRNGVVYLRYRAPPVTTRGGCQAISGTASNGIAAGV